MTSFAPASPPEALSVEGKRIDRESVYPDSEPAGVQDRAAAQIESVFVRTIRVPLDVPTAFARRLVLHRDYVVVRVRTRDGHSGIGFCYAGSTAGGIVAMAVRELLAPLLLGADAHCTEALWQAMYHEALLHGRTGSAMRALSILDVALWDHNARAAGLPLYRYLGSACTTGSVPAYASGGYYIEGKTPEMLGEEMARYVAAGFRAVKMKVGRAEASQDAARVKCAREAIGPDVLLMLDANNAWADLPTALDCVHRFEPYNPFWIEEPFSPDDIDNHARLAARTDTPVATGEIEAGRWRFKEILDKGAAAILQTDAAVCGGITEFRRIAAMAAGYGVTLCPHWFHDLHVHLVASIPNGQFVEYFPDDQVLNFRRLLNTQLTHKDGMLRLPTGAGLGFDFDEQAIEKWAIDV